MTDTFKPVECVEFLGHGGKKVSPNLVDAIRKKQGLRPSQIRTADGTKQRVWIGKILRSRWMRMTSGSGCEAKSSTLAAGPSRSAAHTTEAAKPLDAG